MYGFFIDSDTTQNGITSITESSNHSNQTETEKTTAVPESNNTAIVTTSTTPNSTTPASTTPTTTKATTVTTPITTISTTTVTPTTTVTTTVTPETTTIVPTNTTTTSIPTSPPTSSSTASSKTTAVPPSSKDRQFDGLSFFGGIILTTCLMAIAAFSWKFYRQCKEGNYRTL
ncbi:MUC24 protein, partial [Pseudoatta argentina]